MQGLNTSVRIFRAARLADDDVGGSVRGDYAQVGQGRAILVLRPATVEMRAQGLGTDLLYDCHIQPATLEVERNDVLLVDDGPYAQLKFRITSVAKPTIILNSPQAHLKIQMERQDEGEVWL